MDSDRGERENASQMREHTHTFTHLKTVVGTSGPTPESEAWLSVRESLPAARSPPGLEGLLLPPTLARLRGALESGEVFPVCVGGWTGGCVRECVGGVGFPHM